MLLLEECRLLGSDAVLILWEPTFPRKASPPSSGWQVFLLSLLHLPVNFNVPSSLILFALMMKVILSKCNILQDPHGVTSQKTVFFIDTAVMIVKILWPMNKCYLTYSPLIYRFSVSVFIFQDRAIPPMKIMKPVFTLLLFTKISLIIISTTHVVSYITSLYIYITGIIARVRETLPINP
jgi:hypothetical protein